MVLTHEPTGVSAEANERRSQAANLAVAQHRLRVRLAIEVRADASACPTALWRERTTGGRVSVNVEHEHFPALLSEALDVLAELTWDDRLAADRLGVSRTQLVRFLQTEPRAIALLNAARAELGLGELR